MKRWLRKEQPTHEDALQASRAVMKVALTRLAYFPPASVEDARRLALATLSEERLAYERGVRRAAD